MNVTITETDSRHLIIDAKVTIKNGEHKLRWSYTNSDGFIVVIYPYYQHDFNPIEHISCVLKQKESEKTIKERTNDITLISFTKANVTGNGVELGGKNDFQTPMLVKVFSYEKQDDNLIIYDQNDDNNTSTIQFVIKYEKKYTPGFLGLRKAKEIIKIRPFEAYFPGLLYYTVDGSKTKYPINENMIGNEFEIQVHGESAIGLKVTDEYKNFFRCSNI